QERLGWMLLCSRACVDDRDRGELRSHTGCSFQGVSNNQHVSILLSNSDSVGQVLAFLHGRTLRLCESERCPSEPSNGRREAQTGPGARLVEQGGHYSPVKHVGPFLGQGLHDFRQV